MKTVLEVLFGLVLCFGIRAVLIYSSLPIFWEHEGPLQPQVYSAGGPFIISGTPFITVLSR